MKYAKLVGLILCVIVMGCSRTDDVLMPPETPSLTGTWVLQTLNGMSLDALLNTDTDENVNNTTQNVYTFNEDGSWTFDLDIHTAFTDTPSLTMVNHVTYIGTWELDGQHLRRTLTDIKADVVITPPENVDILLGTEESIFEEQYAAGLLEDEQVTGLFQIEYDGDMLTLTKVGPDLVEPYVVIYMRK